MAENEDLKRQVDDLTTELNTIKLEQYELDNLRELLKLDQKYPSYDKVRDKCYRERRRQLVYEFYD